MATRKKKSSRSKKKPPVAGFRWKSALFHLTLIVLLLLAAYSLWLDRQVTDHFESQRWSLPAEVYARPLELHAGKALTPDQLVTELELLGYRSSANLSGPGHYRRQSGRVDIHTRGFRFPDDQESARRLRLEFSADSVANMSDPDSGAVVALVRLDPLLIDKIYPLHNEDRELISLETVPVNLVRALLVTEDRHFYQHFGIDPLAVVRAAWVNLRSGEIRQGASTLTQQLAKNFYLSAERRWLRKLNEVLISLILEYHYSKDAILEAYLNEIFLGQDGNRAIHGFGEAAWFYFGRPLAELTLDQQAMLVGLARGASYYNPRRHPQRAMERRNRILAMMREQSLLDDQQLASLQQQPLDLTNNPRRSGSRYPAYMELVREQLKNEYRESDLRNEGLRIFTALDPVRQQIAQSSLRTQIRAAEKERNLKAGLQGAVIITGAQDGEIQALAGGTDGGRGGFNRALNASRQIGSLVKPAVYLTALSQPDNYHLLSHINDVGIEWTGEDGNTWRPGNYDGEIHGEVSIIEALSHSYNLATVNLGLELGVHRVRRVLAQLGVEEGVRNLPSLFLGAVEMTPIQVTRMYQIFASGGYAVPLRTIRAVQARDGSLIQHYGVSVERRLQPGHAFLINYLLSRVVEEGTARRLKQQLPNSLPLAGKTGTTDELRDSWFVGYGSDILSVVWIGRDNNQPAGLTGSSGALRVWGDMMRQIRPQALDLSSGEGIEWRWYDESVAHFTRGECSGSSRIPVLSETPLPELLDCNQDGGDGAGVMDFFKNLFR